MKHVSSFQKGKLNYYFKRQTTTHKIYRCSNYDDKRCGAELFVDKSNIEESELRKPHTCKEGTQADNVAKDTLQNELESPDVREK